MYKEGQDRKQFKKILKLPDSNEKYLMLCDFMFKVIPWSCFWYKAQEESRRLEELGFGF